MEVSAFTEEVADLRVRYQIIFLKDSAMIWVQPATAESTGSFPCLSLAMPIIRGGDTLPPATTVVGGGADATSQGIAQKISKRCGIAIWACITLPNDVSVVEEFVFRRLLRELHDKGYGGELNGTSRSAAGE